MEAPSPLELWQGTREVPRRELGQKSLLPINAAIGAEPRSATKLAPIPVQTDGFIALPDNNTVLTPNSAGAVSPDFVVTALSSELRVQDRTGKDLRTLSMAAFWAPLGPFRGGMTQPRIVWDQNAKRFTMIILSDVGYSSSSMLIARSTTASPLGEWRMTRISSGLINHDFDAPNMVIAGRSLAISVSVYDTIFYEKTINYVFPLASLYDPTASINYRSFDDDFGSSAPAADLDPNRSRILFTNSAYLVSNGAYAVVFKTATVASNGSVTVGAWVPANAAVIASYSNGETLPQLGGDMRIYGGTADMSNCVARGTSVWCVNAVRVGFNTETRVVVQYYRANWPDNGDPTLTERVRVDDTEGKYYYAYPSIAVNKNNDLFIGYNRFSRDAYAGAYYAIRKATDPAGALSYDHPLKLGEDYFLVSSLLNLWGKYSTSLMDPVDETSFWSLQQYAATRTAAGGSRWGTFWGKIGIRTAPCTLRLDRTTGQVAATGGSIRVVATAPLADCSNIIAPNAGWITKESQSTSGVTTTYDFRVGLSRLATPRSATISFGTELFTVTQAGNPTALPAEPTLNVISLQSPTTVKAGESVTLTARVRNDGNLDATTFRIGFYISTKTPVTNKDTYTGIGCIQAQGLVADREATCTVSYEISGATAPGTYYIAAIADDREEVRMTDRTLSSRVADSGAIVVTPSANAPSITSSAVVHGATAVAGAVSPGEILVIYGSRLGPAALTTLTLDAQGRVSTTLTGTRILFDGVAAPLIYTSPSQISAIVPYSVAGKTSVQAVPEYNGVRGAPITLSVVAAAPGLFSVDFSGKNQVAALNEDASVNSAANPAERGKVVVLYGTGGGTFKTAPVDGAVIGAPLPEFQTPLTVEIGGVPAEVVFSGPAPGLVSGVFQLNARIPDSIEVGEKVSVIVRSGAFSSPAGTTIAVK